MKYLKRITTALIAGVMMLSMCTPVLAIDVNTGAGGHNELYIHKIDQKALEKYLTHDYGAGAYAGSTAVNTGVELKSSDVIGVWIATEKGKKTNITVADIDEYNSGTYGAVYLANIPFEIKEVKPNSGKAGSANVNDYTEEPGGTSGSGKTDKSGILHFIGLTDGYYRVTETPNSTSTSKVDFIIALPYDPTGNGKTSNIVHAYPKNTTEEPPVITKEIPSKGINGNVISWETKSEIPTTISEEVGGQIYKITDTYDSRLTLDNTSIVIYCMNASERVRMKGGEHYSVSYTDNEFTITLLDKGYSLLAGLIADSQFTDKNLYVEYNTIVTLTEDELIDLTGSPITNKVVLNFTNDSGTTYDSTKAISKVDFGGIKIIKQDSSDSSVKLKDVKFEVYTDEKATTALRDKDGNPIVLKTDSDGTASFYGLGAGTYYLKEVASSVPSGYKALSGLKAVGITVNQAENQQVVDITIKNHFDNSITLPITGGAGTMIFTIAGIVLIAVAGVIFLVSRKKKNTSN